MLRKLTTKDKKDLFTKKVIADNSTYFIDAKMASNGRDYFKITQSKKIKLDTFERSYIMMFEEDFDLFAAGLKKVISFLKKLEVAWAEANKKRLMISDHQPFLCLIVQC